MEQVGGDGFLITSPVMRLNRRYVTEITDGLIPELQKRGLSRRQYTTTMLRAPTRVLSRRDDPAAVAFDRVAFSANAHRSP